MDGPLSRVSSWRVSWRNAEVRLAEQRGRSRRRRRRRRAIARGVRLQQADKQDRHGWRFHDKEAEMMKGERIGSG